MAHDDDTPNEDLAPSSPKYHQQYANTMRQIYNLLYELNNLRWLMTGRISPTTSKRYIPFMPSGLTLAWTLNRKLRGGIRSSHDH